MSLTLIVFAGFYDPDRHAIAYADRLAQATGSQLVLLHVNRAAVLDPYELAGPAGEAYRMAELARQTNTMEALRQQARTLHAPATVEVATDLQPELARDLATRYAPALFVLGQPDEDHADFADLATATADILRSFHHPLLVVPQGYAPRVPHRLLLAADGEPFALTKTTSQLRELLRQLATSAVVAHVSDGPSDEGCSAALRAVENSGLVDFLTPELRGYDDSNPMAGLVAAVRDTQADLVVVLARYRSYWSDVFHRSVTVRLLEASPVPVLVLPVAAVAAAMPASAAPAAAHHVG
jgi:nucleotide-binding universal stress UspA family protein